MYIGLDPRTQEVVAEITTLGSAGDATMTGQLLEKSGKGVKSVIADGSYDREISRSSIKKRGAKALIPPPKNARFRGNSGERDEALKVIRGLGGDRQAKWRREETIELPSTANCKTRFATSH